MPLSRFLRSSTDGFQEDQLCDGTSHYLHLEAVLEGEVEHASRRGPCDGSCRPEARRVDVRAVVSQRGERAMRDGGKTLRSVVEFVDQVARELFAGDAPVTGVEFERWYCKRDSEGFAACTGEAHVRVSISHDWWSGHKTGRFETIKVMTTPCDGSCQPLEVDAFLLTATSEQE